MRIIAGKYGSRILKTPIGDRIHPMGERVRNAIFNKIGEEIIEAKVLDAFAGTGAIGIEALSRGASLATFVEKDRLVAKILRDNLETFGIEASVIHATALQFLETNQQVFDIIFADPPYRQPQVCSVEALATALKPGGLLVVSNPKNIAPLANDQLKLIDERSYADAKISFYRKN